MVTHQQVQLLAGSDGIVTNDAGTMRQTTVDTFDTYLAATSKTLTNKSISLGSNTITGTTANLIVRYQMTHLQH